MVLVSIGSVLDPSLAPKGKHVIHAYTPGNEPLDLWWGSAR
jgi:phytoene dehydrogenase-like protein